MRCSSENSRSSSSSTIWLQSAPALARMLVGLVQLAPPYNVTYKSLYMMTVVSLYRLRSEVLHEPGAAAAVSDVLLLLLLLGPAAVILLAHQTTEYKRCHNQPCNAMPLHGKGDPGKRRSNTNPCQPSSRRCGGATARCPGAPYRTAAPLHDDTGVLTARFYRRLPRSKRAAKKSHACHLTCSTPTCCCCCCCQQQLLLLLPTATAAAAANSNCCCCCC
jgi:hypothetical protein